MVYLVAGAQSVTAGVARGISETLHADPSLTAAKVILTGMMSAIGPRDPDHSGAATRSYRRLPPAISLDDVGTGGGDLIGDCRRLQNVSRRAPLFSRAR
ncbi:LrgB family protein [Bradyrhizobium sp. CIR3A]|uniref:LrgB family protein n=1 Tax=Bradyrhizobium sp. CIR3A TaxID=2663838 RepID=UPI00390CC3F4